MSIVLQEKLPFVAETPLSNEKKILAKSTTWKQLKGRGKLLLSRVPPTHGTPLGFSKTLACLQVVVGGPEDFFFFNEKENKMTPGFVRISWSEVVAQSRTRSVSGLRKSFQPCGAERKGRQAGLGARRSRGAGSSGLGLPACRESSGLDTHEV